MVVDAEGDFPQVVEKLEAAVRKNGVVDDVDARFGGGFMELERGGLDQPDSLDLPRADPIDKFDFGLFDDPEHGDEIEPVQFKRFFFERGPTDFELHSTGEGRCGDPKGVKRVRMGIEAKDYLFSG